MSRNTDEADFPHGLLRPELFLGVASSVTARTVGVNLSEAGHPSGSHFAGGRYGRGEVGEFVLIEGQLGILLGRIAEVKLREPERRTIKRGFSGNATLDALGTIQLLGCVGMDDLRVTAGVGSYPRLGDRIYAAPHKFISRLPQLMETRRESETPVTLNLGSVDAAHESEVSVNPERLFGRHCAILGATGWGKSWTTARIVEECLRYQCKLILVDATGEYCGFQGTEVVHCHLGVPGETTVGSRSVSLPPTCFVESDFMALFEPSGKVQGPKLRAAIRSLRLARLNPQLASENGLILKINQSSEAVFHAEQDPQISALLDDPGQEFDVTKLSRQIEQECVRPPKEGEKRWGREDGNFSYCLPLVTRINGILASRTFACVFRPEECTYVLTDLVDEFLHPAKGAGTRLLRICLSGVAYEYKAREIMANVIGRHLLNEARKGTFRERPAVVFVDEAHNFLGRHIGGEDDLARLDAFELIAKEGRKYGLNICLASQRPRDITDGVLSQMGTLIVHRLTNDHDREVVERACGEIDRAASAFLPNLRPGEAAIIGTDFPIPLTIRIHEPSTKPLSDGPRYQKYWNVAVTDSGESKAGIIENEPMVKSAGN